MKAKTKALKKRIINSVSSLMATPWRAKYGWKASKYSGEADVLREARRRHEEPDMELNGMPSEAFKLRSVADGIRTKYKKGVK